ncbi:MAG: hypothetical protein AAB446_01035 [Patescibacteria group bacterium]
MDQNKELHHASVVIGDDCRSFVLEILINRLNFNTKANPDFLLIENQSFGIDEVRNLERWAIGKPLVGDVKASLIIVNSITFEAQNALLKILEEPPLGTYFFINLQSLGGLLPTFLSRVRILFLRSDLEKKSQRSDLGDGNAKKFLLSQIKEKFSMIRSLSKKEDPTSLKLRGASKNEMKELIKNLEEIAYKNNFKAQDLKNILIAKTFASVRGSSPKMLLEWLSCVL